MKRRLGWRILLLVILTALMVAPFAIIYYWHNQQQGTPPIWPLPEDPAEARKAVMINTLLPLIQKNNRRLLEQRGYAENLLDRVRSGQSLDEHDRQWLTSLGKRYRLPAQDRFSKDWLALLLRRLDIIPADLALAQAAMESAWGESRFAAQGNNFFGQWCYRKGCGIVPARRPAGANYEVQRFASVEDSVRLYMRNLNSHPRYTQLRILRQKERAKGDSVNGLHLAAGLHGYSAIGDTYIHTLRALIRVNDLQRFSNY